MILEHSKVINIINTHIINHKHHHNSNVLMYTYLDLMMELAYQLDKVFILIVKLFHLIVNMRNHVGHDLAISHYHIKYKVQLFQVIVNLHDLQFQMLLTVMRVDMNVVLVLVIQMIKLQLIYK